MKYEPVVSGRDQEVDGAHGLKAPVAAKHIGEFLPRLRSEQVDSDSRNEKVERED